MPKRARDTQDTPQESGRRTLKPSGPSWIATWNGNAASPLSFGYQLMQDEGIYLPDGRYLDAIMWIKVKNYRGMGGNRLDNADEDSDGGIDPESVRELLASLETKPKVSSTAKPKSSSKKVSSTIDLTNNEAEKPVEKKPIDLAIAVVAMYHIYEASSVTPSPPS
ncbi:hypothetical protein Ct61P_15109 [Colletotrichum tofieldiae]|nr:hypothetical protein Ct61P_15109 [Colletotrichum tofieldiae]